jgi:hypothetical protein
MRHHNHRTLKYGVAGNTAQQQFQGRYVEIQIN